LPDKISNSYGSEITDFKYKLLLRHRAILFGIIGGIIMYSAISTKPYSLAVCIGYISMISFVILLKLVHGEINHELNKVLKIDIIGIVILLFGFLLYPIQLKT